MHLAESSSTLFCLWTGLSLPVALHPASQRRSYLPLRTGQCSRPERTFTLLLVRTFRRTLPGTRCPSLHGFQEPAPTRLVELAVGSLGRAVVLGHTVKGKTPTPFILPKFSKRKDNVSGFLKGYRLDRFVIIDVICP